MEFGRLRPVGECARRAPTQSTPDFSPATVYNARVGLRGFMVEGLRVGDREWVYGQHLARQGSLDWRRSPEPRKDGDFVKLFVLSIASSPVLSILNCSIYITLSILNPYSRKIIGLTRQKPRPILNSYQENNWTDQQKALSTS